jgi:hypothetical protein
MKRHDDTRHNPLASVGKDVVLPASVNLSSKARVGDRVVFAEGAPALVRDGAEIEAAAVIAPGIEIGRDALVKVGAVVTQSVPANAIVEGNPARVVGYRMSGDGRLAEVGAKVITASVFDGKVGPSKQELGVGGAAVFLMHRVSDVRGSLSVGEIERDLPFPPERYFLVYDVPSSELRGEHAHKACHQFLVCVHGSCRLLLDDGISRVEVTLDRPELGVHMPPMLWGTQYRYTADAVLMVFASHAYDADDYIRSYEEYIALRDV